ncbi:hypothetical protein amrb99_50480 [Actinomadura sp. RB99]|uniref:protein kinase domain-containing protein n=1 Tax=Actinomadura sp. RB99 TaxID=2691577 RepID=UPI001681F716|nr:hypothetical protein [Actinomadura sp. RB99]
MHRDIKSADILEGERVVAFDFGLAAVPGETALTADGALLGTPAYLAPEQVDDRETTAASDVWSLRVILDNAVEGRRRHDGGAAADRLAGRARARRARAGVWRRSCAGCSAAIRDGVPARRTSTCCRGHADTRKVFVIRPCTPTPSARWRSVLTARPSAIGSGDATLGMWDAADAGMHATA